MMAKEKNSVPTRLPAKVYSQLNDAMNERFKKGLVKRKKCTLTEGMRLVERTPEWKLALQKLKTMPKGRNND